MKLDIKPRRTADESIAGSPVIENMPSYGSAREDAIKIKVVGISRQTLAGAKTINESTDVDVTDLADGAMLQWNAAANKYVLTTLLGGDKTQIAIARYGQSMPPKVPPQSLAYLQSDNALYIGGDDGVPVKIGGGDGDAITAAIAALDTKLTTAIAVVDTKLTAAIAVVDAKAVAADTKAHIADGKATAADAKTAVIDAKLTDTIIELTAAKAELTKAVTDGDAETLAAAKVYTDENGGGFSSSDYVGLGIPSVANPNPSKPHETGNVTTTTEALNHCFIFANSGKTVIIDAGLAVGLPFEHGMTFAEIAGVFERIDGFTLLTIARSGGITTTLNVNSSSGDATAINVSNVAVNTAIALGGKITLTIIESTSNAGTEQNAE